jgi:hypothetical protein
MQAHTCELMRKQIYYWIHLILALYGMSMGYGQTLWYVVCCHHIFLINFNHFQPFTHDFPHADIHELIMADLLHQLIKGTFKDHLVTWVQNYLTQTHGKAHTLSIIQDIDHR